MGFLRQVLKDMEERQKALKEKYPGCFDSAATYRKKQRRGLLPPTDQALSEEEQLEKCNPPQDEASDESL